MEDFVVYSKPGCSFCTKVVAVFDAKGVSYTKLTLHEEYTKLDFVTKFGKTTFPQVTHNGQPIGGFTDTVNYLIANGYV